MSHALGIDTTVTLFAAGLIFPLALVIAGEIGGFAVLPAGFIDGQLR